MTFLNPSEQASPFVAERGLRCSRSTEAMKSFIFSSLCARLFVPLTYGLRCSRSTKAMKSFIFSLLCARLFVPLCSNSSMMERNLILRASRSMTFAALDTSRTSPLDGARSSCRRSTLFLPMEHVPPPDGARSSRRRNTYRRAFSSAGTARRAFRRCHFRNFGIKKVVVPVQSFI